MHAHRIRYHRCMILHCFPEPTYLYCILNVVSQPPANLIYLRQTYFGRSACLNYSSIVTCGAISALNFPHG